MIVKLEMSDGMSNHSDFSNDSENSQESTAEFRIESGILITPSTFIALEGLNSGVPTRTTPTLTPTTLRNIEQTFIELQSKPETHENEAGFVPPLVHSIGNNQYVSASDATDLYVNPPSKSPSIWQSSLSQSSSDSNTRSTPPLSQKTNFNNTPQGTTRRNMGGRKPIKDHSISPEEEERRRIRRERNKAAAARCRKRRVDHTNCLVKEVDELEQKRQKLIEEQVQLKQVKEHLEYLLEAHKNSPECRRPTSSPPDVKPFDHMYYNKPTDARVKTEIAEPLDPDDVFLLPSPKKAPMLSQTITFNPKPSRPNTLNVAVTQAPTTRVNEVGIPITTPSHGLIFNFESLMGGGTGLTPVNTPLIPSCSSQQRYIPISVADITSPDSQVPPKLVSL
ncbi:transcription factor kayak isoform X1 [Euwallacea similis]|uniref:transcription factor kayak isoform X1 n=1 Tax=Euwallacea similis TaxID=1736056 RepID=UPI00344BEFB0